MAWLSAILEPAVTLRFTTFGSATQPRSWEGFADRRVPEHLVWAVATESWMRTSRAAMDPATGRILPFPPGTLHTFVRGDARQPLAVHFFRFELLRGDVPLHLAHEPVILDPAPPLREHLEALHDDRQAADEAATIRIRARLALMLSTAFQILDASSVAGGSLSYVQRRQLYEMLAERRGTRVRPADLAERLALSPEYFARLFSRTFGMPPRRWLIEQRVRDAANTLAESTLTISQVAHELGYRDIYQFSHQFKQILGASPRSYRHRERVAVRGSHPAGATISLRARRCGALARDPTHHAARGVSVEQAA